MNKKNTELTSCAEAGKSIKNISLTENDKIEKLWIEVLKLKNDNIREMSNVWTVKLRYRGFVTNVGW